MSYYENRIKALEEKVSEMAKRERMKAIPVEARLIDSIAILKAEVERLRKAGDAMVLKVPDMMAGCVRAEEAIGLMNDWIAAKEGKPSA